MQIIPYSENNLAVSLANKYTPAEVISSKNHFIFLTGYLSHADINAKTIVIEEDYISKDFLHDYASYYSLCFEQYSKFCKRVHFFSKTFSADEFKTIILEKCEDNSQFWESYLGFIVVKPIPVTVIGYTVLKTYASSHDFNARNFWGVRKYKVHFYGNEVELTSLAFQEQDSVLSACATTAIWSMLNKASVDFHTILKSPSQITKDADSVSPDGSRLFPNKGLNLLQICQAILNSGLVSEVKQPDYIFEHEVFGKLKIVSNRYLKKILSAYSPIGIPIILVVNVPSGNTYGLHAITVSGYKQTSPIAIPPRNKITWLSDNIEKFYAHDDQWGPFARIEFKNEAELITPWTLLLSPDQHPTFVNNIIVPLYPKIRISYEDIEAIVLGLDMILTLFFNNKIVSDLVWDIKIDFSENHKSRLKSSSLEPEDKIKKLTKSLPKYLWIASCYIDNFKILEFTFDATDVRSGMIGEDVISYLPDNIKDALKQHLKLNQTLHQKLFDHMVSITYYQFLIDKL